MSRPRIIEKMAQRRVSRTLRMRACRRRNIWLSRRRSAHCRAMIASRVLSFPVPGGSILSPQKSRTPAASVVRWCLPFVGDLLAFKGLRAEHRIHVPATNPIALIFAIICHHTDRTNGCLTLDGTLAMILKLGTSVERSGWRLRGWEYLAKVT